MLFSATLDGAVRSLTNDYQRDPVRHEVGATTPDVIAADHLFWHVTRSDRIGVSARAIDAAGSTIVFCRTRHGCDRVAKQLARRGISTAAIHGRRNQNQRTRALNDFATGRVRALVATDVVARGIHVEDVQAIIHFDLPADHKAYLHRSGRTARAGKGGIVISLVPPDQVKELRHMTRRLGLRQPITNVDLTAIPTPGPKTRRPGPSRMGAGSNGRPMNPRRPRRTSGRPANRRPSRHRPSSNKRSPSNRRNRRVSTKATNRR